MRAVIPGVYRIFSSKSRNKHHFAYRKKYSQLEYRYDRQEFLVNCCKAVPEDVTV